MLFVASPHFHWLEKLQLQIKKVTKKRLFFRNYLKNRYTLNYFLFYSCGWTNRGEDRNRDGKWDLSILILHYVFRYTTALMKWFYFILCLFKNFYIFSCSLLHFPYPSFSHVPVSLYLSCCALLYVFVRSEGCYTCPALCASGLGSARAPGPAPKENHRPVSCLAQVACVAARTRLATIVIPWESVQNLNSAKTFSGEIILPAF